jgi:hypothetical protein
MELFWGIFFSFPVIIFSALLTICILYWVIAALGLLSVDCLDIDISVNDIYSDVPPNGFGGLLMKFGFNGVPMTLIITLISLIGWSISYFSFRLLILPLYDLALLYYVAGIVLFIVSFISSVYLTAFIIKPIRPLFKGLMVTHNYKSSLGQIVEIRSSSVTKTRGQATCEDGGAGLILEVRCDESYQFKRGDKAVILQYDETANCYEIISLEDFNGQ